MAISKDQKEQILAQLTDNFKQAKTFVIANYQGLTVRELADFRGALDESGSIYIVAKKTLIKKAAESSGYTIPENQLDGAIGIAFSFNDELAPIQISYKFAQKHDKLKPLGGVMDGEMLTIEALKQLASLPSRNELLAKLVGTINAPVSGFVRVLAGPMRGFQSVITQLQKQKV